MDLSTVLVVCSGTVVVGILALQTRWGTLTERTPASGPTPPVVTRPDLRPLPSFAAARRERSRRAA